MAEKKARDQWVSKIGLVLAMAGNAVGLGNFIRFPMQAAKNGGGAFMIPYLIAFLFLGLPIMFVEWAMGRYGGSKGHATMPGILSLIRNNKLMRWLGAIAVWVPLVIASYYCFIESWAMGYSFFSLFNVFGNAPHPENIASFFHNYVTLKTPWTYTFYVLTLIINSFILYRGISQGIEKAAKILMPMLFIFAVILVIRVVTLGSPLPEHPNWNINKGFGFIWNPRFSDNPKLTIDDLKKPGAFAIKIVKAEDSLSKFIKENLSSETLAKLEEYYKQEGTNFAKNGRVEHELSIDIQKMLVRDINQIIMGNLLTNQRELSSLKLPDDIKGKISKNPRGVDIDIINRDILKFVYPDEIAAYQKFNFFGIWLAAAGQIFFTLSLGMGAIACYASYVKKDDDVVASGLATALTNETTEVILGGSIAIPLAVAFFGLGATRELAASSGLGFAFVTMPLMFTKIPFGFLFGAIWFMLLFFAGITSSIAMGQIVVAFFEEIVGLSRKASVAIAMGGVLILSQLAIFGFSKGALDEMDTLAGTIALPIFALIEVLVWVHIFGIDRSWKELMQGARIRLWEGIKWITAIISPLFLMIIIGGWLLTDGMKWLKMEGVPKENVPMIWVTRGVLLLVFLLLGWLSTHNMHHTEIKEEEVR